MDQPLNGESKNQEDPSLEEITNLLSILLENLQKPTNVKATTYFQILEILQNFQETFMEPTSPISEQVTSLFTYCLDLAQDHQVFLDFQLCKVRLRRVAWLQNSNWVPSVRPPILSKENLIDFFPISKEKEIVLPTDQAILAQMKVNCFFFIFFFVFSFSVLFFSSCYFLFLFLF